MRGAIRIGISAAISLIALVPPAAGADPLTIVVFGDSISAAYGMETEQGWVHLLSERFGTGAEPVSGPGVRKGAVSVINASVSGETTGGGVVRLPKMLEVHQPDLVILELGGNDGLRGYPIDNIRDNIAAMIRDIRATGADVLLIGMVLPPNYGRRYTRAFQDLYREVADRFKVDFVPFLLEGVTTPGSLLQRDGIHPTPEAQGLLLDDVWPRIETWLASRQQQPLP